MVNSFDFDEIENLIMDAIDVRGYRVRDYTASDDEPVDQWDFTTTEDLHNAYMGYCFRAEAPQELVVSSVDAFGRRLTKMLWPNAKRHRLDVRNPKTDEINTKRGFRGIWGPKSIRMNRGPGRPKVSDIDNTD